MPLMPMQPSATGNTAGPVRPSLRGWMTDAVVMAETSSCGIVILPHMGSATIEGRVEMGEKVIINIRAFLDNHKPPDRVLPSML